MKGKNRRVIGRIAAVRTPSVVFLTTSSFAGHQVRISPLQAGRFDRFVHVEHDLVLGRFFNNPLIVPHHVLAVMVLHRLLALVIDALDKFLEFHITGLQCMDAKAFVKAESVRELSLVVDNRTGRFVVADQGDPFTVGVARKFVEIKIRIGLRETEFVAIGGPIAIPTLIPAFGQNSIESILGGEVDVAFDILGVGSMSRAGTPRRLVEVHFPPNANEFARFDPTRVSRAYWVRSS